MLGVIKEAGRGDRAVGQTGNLPATRAPAAGIPVRRKTIRLKQHTNQEERGYELSDRTGSFRGRARVHHRVPGKLIRVAPQL